MGSSLSTYLNATVQSPFPPDTTGLISLPGVVEVPDIFQPQEKFDNGSLSLQAVVEVLPVLLFGTLELELLAAGLELTATPPELL